MTATVVSDAPVALRGQKEHLIFKGIRRQRPAVTENDRLALAPVFVVDLRAVFSGDSRFRILIHKCSFPCHSVSNLIKSVGAGGRRLRLRRRNLVRGLLQPILETCLPKLRALVRHETPLAQLSTEVFCVWISNHFALIIKGFESLPDEVVETKTVRTGDFKHAIQRCSNSYSTERSGDILCGYRLEKNRRQANSVVNGGLVGNPFAKLEELRRVDDRVGDRTFLD